MKIVVLGNNGMLGKEIFLYLQNKNYNVIGFDLPYFDILKDLNNNFPGDIIINCIAYTDVEKAEFEPNLAYEINANILKKLSEICKNKCKYLIHFSTDFVFGDLKNDLLDENDIPYPLNIYGKSKLLGEFKIIDSGCKYTILRIQWTYGQYGKNNFIHKIIEKAKENKELKVVNDQIGSPTYTYNIAKVIEKFINNPYFGIFHYADKGYMSRYDVAKLIINELNIDCNIISCKTEEFNSKVKRPLNSKFNCSKIENLLNIERSNCIDTLKMYLNNFKNNYII